MGRGGRAKERDGPDRRCLVTGAVGDRDPLIRFVLDPEGRATPDLAEKLPGRGFWITAERAVVDKAVAKKLFARAARSAVDVAPDLSDRLETLLARRLIDAISIARKAGSAVAGFAKAKEAAPWAHLLLQAWDGAEGGKRKLRGAAEGAEEFECLSAAELGLAFGRGSVVHVVLTDGGATDRVQRECLRLGGFRRPLTATKTGDGARA